MKRSISVLAFLLTVGALNAQTVTLDEAIQRGVDNMRQYLKRGSKLAVINFRAASGKMSTYVIEELTMAIVNDRTFTLVDRQQLDLVQEEMDFQYSGEVSDASAQAAGRILGAQSIISGSMEAMGPVYRFRLKVIEVETAAIQLSFGVNVKKDEVVQALMDVGVGVTGSGGFGESAPAPQPSAPQPYAPQPSAPQYTAPQSAWPNNDFTTGQRFGTWGLNWLIPGLGSFVVMQDIAGGTIMVASAITAIYFVATMKETSEEYDAESYYYTTVTSINEGKAIAGVCFSLFTGIFNIARSATYHKKAPRTASVMDLSAWDVAYLPAAAGESEKVRLSYTLRF